jgi:hypothetical protein
MDYSQPSQIHGLKPKGSNHGGRAVGMKHLPRGVEDVVDGARDDARVGVGVVRGECHAAAGLPIGEIHPVDGGGREGGSSPSGRSTTVGRWSCSAAGRSAAPPHLIWMWGGGRGRGGANDEHARGRGSALGLGMADGGDADGGRARNVR